MADNFVYYYEALSAVSEPSTKKQKVEEPKAAAKEEPKKQAQPKKEEPEKKKDDDFDLFAEDPEADAAWEAEIQRRADENEKKKKEAGKKRETAKSAVVIDVKPWDDTTDLGEIEKGVRAIAMNGLEWKASQLIAIAFGVKKLSISCHIVDELVSVDDIQEQIQENLSELVQSTDIQSFTKL